MTEGRLIAGVACGRTCGIDVGSGAIQRPAKGAARQKVVETAVTWGRPRRRKGREQQKRKAEQWRCGHVVFNQMKSTKAYVQNCSAAQCAKNEGGSAWAAAALLRPAERRRELGIDFRPHESTVYTVWCKRHSSSGHMSKNAPFLGGDIHQAVLKNWTQRSCIDVGDFCPFKLHII